MLMNYQGAAAGRISRFQERLKRGFDLVGATIALVLLSPLLVFVCFAIKLDSPGPVLRRVKYYDLDDAMFEAFEFRCSMSDEQVPNCPITRIGLILRCSGLDKIPQLLNVLHGDMSMVGPHPFAVTCGAAYRARVAPEHLHNVRPGIFSWAQVHEGETKVYCAQYSLLRRIDDDCYYVTNRTFLLDMKILVASLFLKITGAS